MMAIKAFTTRMEEAMYEKLEYVAEFEGRSVNSELLVLVRERIEKHESKYGEITGEMNPEQSVKLGRANLEK